MREAFDPYTGETVKVFPGGRECYGCGGAGCYTCEGTGVLPSGVK
jgi:hypothetical protein